jgi:tripartite-type tricarboxylate transporter receptor subunit TctC
MTIERNRLLHFVAATVGVIFFTQSGQSASLQAPRTVKIVVAASPGGATDLVARLLADQIGQAQGATMVVENRTGASGVIGTEAVSRAAPTAAPCS